MQFPRDASADAGAIGVANPVCDLVLDKIENARPAVITAEPPPIKLAVGFRRFGGVCNKAGAAAPAFDHGEVGVGGGGGVGVGVSVHLEALRAPLGATIVVVTLILRQNRLVILNNLGKIPE